MKPPILVSRKGRSSVGFEIGRLIRPHNGGDPPRGTRKITNTTTALSSPSPAEQHPINNGRETLGNTGSRVRGKLADRDFYLDILSSTSTKREAKSYLSRFQPSKKLVPSQTATQSAANIKELDKRTPKPTPVNAHGVNLGSFYLPAKAVDDSPVFTQVPVSKPFIDSAAEPLHVALIKIRAPQLLDNGALRGIGNTLSQLARLGLSCVVVVDCEGANFVDSNKQETTDLRKLVAEQADRVVASIEVIRGSEARRLESIIEVSPPNIRQSPLIEVSGGARVTNRSLLLAPLRRGVIPVIAPIGYMPSTHTLVYVDADEIILALTREFAGIQTTPLPDEDPVEASERIKGLQKQTSVDRIIVLDPVGGIPSADRVNGSHVFINLEQELDGINAELLQLQSPGRTSACAGVMPKTEKIALTSLDANQSGPRSNGTGIKPLPRRMNSTVPGSFSASVSVANTHLKNLKLLQRTLALLPPSSSALITTPEEAANSGRLAPNSFQAYGVGTRRQRNPLIHNLLTDKPIFSSSLPAGRLATVSNPVQANGGKDSSPTTFVKRGMPLTILPDPRLRSWAAPKKGEPELTLEDPRIDLPRLVHLIDDSFNRKLDVKHYLERVNDRIAGIIIAGEYEGGALLTWETPPGVPDDGSEESRLRKVPYLDKFAVLQRSQGAGGVADIVFNAMVRDCFPNGVCWRSRRDNPVNKWYFERARGTWKIPRSNWTMFWTTEGVVEDEQTFLDYEGVCKSVVPSWADKKAVID